MKRAGSFAALAAMCILGSSLTACGGAASSPSVALPVKATTEQVSFSIAVPAAVTSAAKRPAYVSSATQSATISVNGTNGATVNCTTTCSGTVSAPIGSDTFAVNLYSAQNAAGNVLSTGSLTQAIVANQANSVNITFNGVPASLALSLSSSGLNVGTPTSVTVTATIKDAAGNTIVGPGGYANAAGNPITVSLASSDLTGAAVLSQTTLTAPPTGPITMTYNGNVIADPTITLSATGLTSATKTLGMTDTFAYTGANQTLTVPAGVTSIDATVDGGASGVGNSAYLLPGAALEANVPVTPTHTLTVIVGNDAQLFPSSGSGVFGGGGPPGNSTIAGSSILGSGGGGASGLLDGAQALIIAGAPGGTDGDGISTGGAAGGSGGVASGVAIGSGKYFPGLPGTGNTTNGTVGGGGGGTNAGGASGATSPSTGGACAGATAGTLFSSGAVGVGGAGDNCGGNNYGGGGGGGGYAGAGGGGGSSNGPNGPPAGASGGGGSSFVISGSTIVSVAATNNGVGSIILKW